MIEIAAALLSSTAATGIAAKLWEVLRERVQEKGATQLPADIATPEHLREAEAALVQTEKRLKPKEVESITLDALAAAHEAANGLRAERMRQAKLTFNAAIGLAVFGVLIIFAGVALLLVRDSVAGGALTAGIGAVTEVVSAILFRLNHETNNRLDEVGRDLSAIEAARIAMTLIDKIEDPVKRDDAIKETAKDLRTRGTKA